MSIPHPQIEEPQLKSYDETEEQTQNFPEPEDEQRILWEELEEAFSVPRYNREIRFMNLPFPILSYLSSDLTLIKLKRIKDKFGLSNQHLQAIAFFIKQLVLGEAKEGVADLRGAIARRLAISEELAEEVAFEIERDILPPVMARIRELYGYVELTRGIVPDSGYKITAADVKDALPVEQPAPEKRAAVARQTVGGVGAKEMESAPAKEQGVAQTQTEPSPSAEAEQRESPAETMRSVPQQKPTITFPPKTEISAVKPVPAESQPEEKPTKTEEPKKQGEGNIVLEDNIIDLRDLIG